MHRNQNHDFVYESLKWAAMHICGYNTHEWYILRNIPTCGNDFMLSVQNFKSVHGTDVITNLGTHIG